MRKPVIGITSGGRSEGFVKAPYYSGYFSAPAPFVDAVLRAGGMPIVVPAAVCEWEAALPILDGVIITGGTDIDPGEYGGDRENPALLPPDRERDESELKLARHLLDEKSLPALCVCRGAQIVNVAAGGALHEHIPDIVDENIHRDSSGDGFWAMQDLRIEPDSLLAKVMGRTALRTASGHHQAVKEVGEGLRVVCRATDGIIEALEMPEHKWLIAVQWHPEVTAEHDPTQQALFDALVTQAANGRAPA